MAEWSKDIRACKTTWSTLRSLDQSDEVFENSGSIKMSGLSFWNALATPEEKRTQANTLAHQIDHTFREIRVASFEPGVTGEVAVNALVQVLTDESKTIADLATVADALYDFLGED